MYGFMSKQLPAELDNQYINIQVVSQRAGETRVYVNGAPFGSFPSGSSVLPYATITIGDLRLNRNLKYTGAVYNFGLYATMIDEEVAGVINTDPITQNWEYTEKELGI